MKFCVALLLCVCVFSESRVQDSGLGSNFLKLVPRRIGNNDAQPRIVTVPDSYEVTPNLGGEIRESFANPGDVDPKKPKVVRITHAENQNGHWTFFERNEKSYITVLEAVEVNSLPDVRQFQDCKTVNEISSVLGKGLVRGGVNELPDLPSFGDGKKFWLESWSRLSYEEGEVKYFKITAQVEQKKNRDSEIVKLTFKEGIFRPATKKRSGEKRSGEKNGAGTGGGKVR